MTAPIGTSPERAPFLACSIARLMKAISHSVCACSDLQEILLLLECAHGGALPAPNMHLLNSNFIILIPSIRGDRGPVKRKENRPRGWLSGSSVVAEHHKMYRAPQSVCVAQREFNPEFHTSYEYKVHITHPFHIIQRAAA